MVLIRPFQTSSTSLLKRIGNPGRDVLKSYADIDLLSAFFIPVSKQLLPVCAVPISQLLCKCIRVSCDFAYQGPLVEKHATLKSWEWPGDRLCLSATKDG